jgi:hypothetical protein
MKSTGHKNEYILLSAGDLTGNGDAEHSQKKSILVSNSAK